MNRVKLGLISLAVLLVGCDNTAFLPKSLKEPVESPSPVAVEPKPFPNAYECMESAKTAPDAPMMDSLKYYMEYVKYCYQFAENEIQEEYLLEKAKALISIAEGFKRINALVPRNNRTLESVGLEGNLQPIK